MNTQLDLFADNNVVQFWKDRKAAWHTAHDGLPSVRRGRYAIEVVPAEVASALLEANHYLGGNLPGRGFCHGVRDMESGELVGVATFGPGGAPGIRRATFPGLFRAREVGEKKYDPGKTTYVERRKGSCRVLDRFCLLDGVPANAETHILKLSFALALDMGVVGVVSFSDPCARTTLDGELIFPGHIGMIYKGKGMLYTGRSSKEECVIFADGRIEPRRSLTAWRNGEKGHTYVYPELLSYGAAPLERDEPRADWLAREVPLISRPFTHTGQHRYVAQLDKTVELSGKLIVQPYPNKAVA